jgi:tetratricopeptide (TPR) repeat protein
LNAADISTLVASLSNTGLAGDEPIDQQLFEESEGLPFFVVEYLKATLEGEPAWQTSRWDLPTSVREALRTRINSVDETARQLLSTAAVIGRTFDFYTLQQASGRSEVETVNGLESLLNHALIVERGGTPGRGSVTYDFTHEKLRQVALEETSLTRRRLLHHRLAEALVSPARSQPEPESLASLVAYHYQRGGDELQAVRYYKMAGENARKLFANRDALAHFQAALALGYPETAALHEDMGDIHTLLGEYQAAVASYQNAAALCKPDSLARIEHKLGNLLLRMGDWELAECHYQAALELIDADQDPAGLSRLYADLSRSAHRRDQPARAMETAGLALELAERSQDKASLAQAHNVLGIIARRNGQPAQAVQHLTESLQLAETLPDPGVHVASLNNLALAYAEDNQLEQAINLTREALQACIRLGDRHREAALHNNLADLYHTAGRQKDSMRELKEAVVIFTEIGVEAGSMKSEIWKLTEW